MKLLVLCHAADSPHELGLRAALSDQCQQRGLFVEWLQPGQLLTADLADPEEPRLVVDCLGIHGNPCVPWLSEELFLQLLSYCNEREWVWLLLSDSQVFPIANKRRYVEADTPSPCNQSGRQMLTREHFIADIIDRYIVLRVGPMISHRGDNLLMQLLQKLLASEPIIVGDAQRFCPTPVSDIARVITAIHDQLDCGAACWGTYHYESADAVTSYEFSEVVLAAAAQYWPIAEKGAALRSVDVEAALDKFPILNCHRIRDTFGIQQQPWRKIIPTLLKQIYTEQQK